MKRLALVITGDRNGIAVTWQRLIAIHMGNLINCYDYVVIVHGACGMNANGSGVMRGIDALVQKFEGEMGISVIPVPAEWLTGNKAGPIRNGHMLDIQGILMGHGYDGLVLGYHDNLPASKGTGGCIRESRRRGVATRAYRSDGSEWEA